MQLNRTGIGLFLFFGIFGLAMVVAPVPGQAGWILKSIGIIWILVVAGLLWYAYRQKKQAERNDQIFRTGLRCRATVLSAGSSATMNEMPIMKLELELDVPGEGIRRVKRREIMPVFAAQRMRPGLVLPAYVATDAPEEFVLVW